MYYLINKSFVATISFPTSSNPSTVSTALVKIIIINSVSLASDNLDLFSALTNFLQPSSQSLSTKVLVFKYSSTESLKQLLCGGTGSSTYIWVVSDSYVWLQPQHIVECDMLYENIKKTSGQLKKFS